MNMKNVKKQIKKGTDDVFYVGVSQPMEVRRRVLECSKEAVQFLQRHEKLKTIREEKFDATLQLRTDVRELKSLMNKLKGVMPKTSLRVKVHEQVPPALFNCSECSAPFKTKGSLSAHEQSHKRNEQKYEKEERAHQARIARQESKKQRTKHSSDLEKLEQELSEIEGKLGEL